MKSKNIAATVLLKDLNFVPEHVQIPVKSTIMVRNVEQDSHLHVISCTNMHHKPWRIRSGERYFQTFNQPGRFEFVTAPQARAKMIVEVVDRVRVGKPDRQPAKDAHTAFGQTTAAPAPSLGTHAKVQQLKTSNPSDEPAIPLRITPTTPTAACSAAPPNKPTRSNMLTRRRRQSAASSSSSSDDEERAAMAMQRAQRKSQAHMLAARHEASPAIARQYVKPVRESSGVQHKQTKAAPQRPQTSTKYKPTKRRALQYARVAIRDFDFSHHNITVMAGGTVEFVLDQNSPKLAEHQLQGESTASELRFVGPLLEVDGCRKFRFHLAVEGDLKVQCQVYPEMVCFIHVAKPPQFEPSSRFRAQTIPSSAAESGTGMFTLNDVTSQESVGSRSRLDSDDETGLSSSHSRTTSTCSSLDRSPTLSPPPVACNSELLGEIKLRATDADAFVCVTEYGFQPAEIVVASNDKVAFISVSNRSHLLSCMMEDSSPLLEGVPLQLPERLVYLQFENPGEYTVLDEVFGFMKCKVVVTEAPAKHSTQMMAEATLPHLETSEQVEKKQETNQPAEPEVPTPINPKFGKSDRRSSSDQRLLPSASKPDSRSPAIKGKKQWKLKQTTAPTDLSSNSSTQKQVVGSAPSAATEQQPRKAEPEFVLHPNMHAVQEWFTSRMCEIELKLVLGAFDRLPTGKRVPILVL